MLNCSTDDNSLLHRSILEKDSNKFPSQLMNLCMEISRKLVRFQKSCSENFHDDLVGVNILTAPMFDSLLFSPDVIILFDNLDSGRLTFLDIRQNYFGNLLCVSGYRVTTA